MTRAPVFRSLSLIALFLGALSFVLAQEEDQATPKPKSSPSAQKSASPTTKASPKKKSAKSTPKPSETPEAKGRKKSASNEDATPAPSTKKKKVSPTASPKKSKSKKGKKGPKKSPSPEKSPSPKKSPSPAEEAPTPSATPAATALSPVRAAVPVAPTIVPQVNVEKSGFLGDQGYEPPPTPAPRRGWWLWSRPEVSYNYLSRSVRSEIDRAPVMRRRWQFIVVHNSGTRQGSARIFDYYHRHVRRMQNGLAYHFVIGNGTSTGDGEIEVGDRWRRQINGGHVHSDYLNNIALGICLVGDFNRGRPTRRQLEACEELINYLRKRCGKIEAHYAVVRPHRDVNPPQWATDCPGDDFPYQWFRRFQE